MRPSNPDEKGLIPALLQPSPMNIEPHMLFSESGSAAWQDIFGAKSVKLTLKLKLWPFDACFHWLGACKKNVTF